ncbi:MAG: hypothetical protein IBJ10_10850 [Phycisphaerales bacterium]|nr:hypothetical protein [Phycisphaerales bacterium]
MQHTLTLLGSIVLGLLALAGILHALPRMGGVGRAIAAGCIRAPGLDVVIVLFTVAPMVIGAAVGVPMERAWLGSLAGCGVGILAMAVTLIVWSRIHEALSPKRKKSERIALTMSSIVGTTRNHLAVWWTTLAAPLFVLVRLAEIIVYPPLTWLVRLPRYNHGDWVNVSRQKFGGLVGYDLAWCLYCDWMTGVWSLGAEMLRNVESFWCPIRFYDGKKCENCKVDFPDVAHGWVDPAAGATLEDVTATLREKYPGPNGVNSWFGHPDRVTVEGKGQR